MTVGEMWVNEPVMNIGCQLLAKHRHASQTILIAMPVQLARTCAQLRPKTSLDNDVGFCVGRYLREAEEDVRDTVTRAKRRGTPQISEELERVLACAMDQLRTCAGLQNEVKGLLRLVS